MVVNDRRPMIIRAVCEVCERRHPGRLDAMGFVHGVGDDPHDWLLQHSSTRLGRDDARAESGSAWGRLKAPSQLVGRRRRDGSLRPSGTDRLRIRCPIGHRLDPATARLEELIADAVERRLPYVVIPER